MNLAYANRIAQDTLTRFNVEDTTVEWDASRTRTGICVFYKSGRKVIKYSRIVFPHLSDEEGVDTILHETAHALLPHTAGHGEQWRQLFIAMGGSGKSALKDSDIVRRVAKWHGKCIVTGELRMTLNRLTVQQRNTVGCTCHYKLLRWVQNN